MRVATPAAPVAERDHVQHPAGDALDGSAVDRREHRDDPVVQVGSGREPGLRPRRVRRSRFASPAR
jgi:hypothetical protein